MTWPRAILLDFYGTVVEEDDGPVEAVCRQISEVSSTKASPEEVASYWSRLMGEMCLESHGPRFRTQREIERLSLDAVLRHFGADLDGDGLLRPVFEYWERPPMFPESKAVIEKCRVPVCLVSNIDNADLASALKHNGLRFEMMVTSEDCRAYKPRPEPFEKALSLLALSAPEVLHVGDSLRADVHGAKALGISVLWINRKGQEAPRAHVRPDRECADLTGMLEVLAKSDSERV